jgi:hypothetical protein
VPDRGEVSGDSSYVPEGGESRELMAEVGEEIRPGKMLRSA